MNTHNTKFTFNKKSFALSLACVSMLATAGNAYTVHQNSTYTTSATVSNDNSIVVNGNSVTNNNHLTGDLTVDMSKGTNDLTIRQEASADGLQNVKITEGVSGAITINGNLTSLVFDNAAISKTVSVNANIGTIGAAGKDIIVSGGTTGISIKNGVTVDSIVGKNFTVSGTGTIKGIENSGTIGNIALTGEVTVSGEGTIGISNTSTGTINGITFGGEVAANKNGILINNEGTITGGIAFNDKATVSGAGNLIQNADGTITGGIVFEKELIVDGDGSAIKNGAAINGDILIKDKVTISGGANAIANTGTITGNVSFLKGGVISGSGTLIENNNVSSEAKIDGTVTFGGTFTTDSNNKATKATFIDNTDGTTPGWVKDVVLAQDFKISFDEAGKASGAYTIISGGKVDTLTNYGTINETKTGDSGSMTIISGGNVGLFTNAGNITLSGAGLISGAGVIHHFVNQGTFTHSGANVVGTTAKIHNFTNEKGGVVNLSGGAITLTGSSVAYDGKTKVNSNNFVNAGTITAKATDVFTVAAGGSNVFNFTNEQGGVIDVQTAEKYAIKSVADTTINVINRGEFKLGNKAGHIDASAGNVNIKEWHLTNIGKAAAYDEGSTSTNGDRIVVKDNATNLTIDKGSLIINPHTSKDFEFNKVYNADNFVVKASDGTAIDGLKDKVSFESFATNDEIFVLNKATISGEQTKTTGRTEITDGFTVTVDASRSAAAAATQNTVNNAITRSAFVGNVVGNAVNTAIANFGTRVSYNDSDVDFSQLEKYAQVRSDVLDQTYAKDSHVFVMPYYTSTSVDIARGGSLDGDTYGLIGGIQKNLGGAGVLGFFVGSESAKADATNLNVDDTTFYAGINYYKTLGGSASYDYFAKGMLRTAFTSSDISTNRGDVKSDSNSYGLEAGVGVNFYVANHTLTPELALSYDRVSADGFTLNNLSYQDNKINLFVAKLGGTWLAQWNEKVSTNVGAGFRFNFKDDFEQGVIVNDQLFNTKTDLSSTYYYVNLGLTYAITNAWDISAMYNGDFSSDTSAHSGFVKLGYWW